MKRWNRKHKLVGHSVWVSTRSDPFAFETIGWVVGVSNRDPDLIRVLVDSKPLNLTKDEWSFRV